MLRLPSRRAELRLLRPKSLYRPHSHSVAGGPYLPLLPSGVTPPRSE